MTALAFSRRWLRRVPSSVIVAALIAAVIIFAALAAPLVSPTNPLDLASFNLIDAEIPPIWAEGGDPRFLLGSDNQGRDVLSAIIYGARVSILIGGGAVFVAATVGVALGLIAGFSGGPVDAVIMRIGDVILSFPTILLALLVAGIARALIPEASGPELAPFILIGAIAIHEWVQYARTVRAATMVEVPQRLRESGPRHRSPGPSHHVPSHSAERDGPGLGDRDNQPCCGGADGGDPVLPRRRHAADLSLAGYAHSDRQRVRFLGNLVDRAISRA